MLNNYTKYLCYLIVTSIVLSSVTWANNGCTCIVNSSKIEKNKNSCCKKSKSFTYKSKSCNNCSQKQGQKQCDCEGDCKCDYLINSTNPISELPKEYTNNGISNFSVKLPVQCNVLIFNIFNRNVSSLTSKEKISKLSLQQTFPLRV